MACGYSSPVCELWYGRLMVVLAVMGILCRGMTGCQVKQLPPVSAMDVLQAMMDESAHTPHGQYKDSRVPQGKEALSIDLLAGLYGETARHWLNDGEEAVLDDAALYLSEQRHPFEIAVFRCKNESDIIGGQGSVVGICQSRLDVISRAWKGSEYDEWVAQSVVFYHKQFVILVVAWNADEMISAAKRIIG